MIVCLSDTHSSDRHQLTPHLQSVIANAQRLCHAGDFTTMRTLDAFQTLEAPLFAVYGNADTQAVQGKLPAERTVPVGDYRLAMTHRKRGGKTGLTMFGRAHDADIVLSGHTHVPAVTKTDDMLLVNPGSHADPRGARPGYAVLEPTPTALSGELREPDGTTIESFRLENDHAEDTRQ